PIAIFAARFAVTSKKESGAARYGARSIARPTRRSWSAPCADSRFNAWSMRVASTSTMRAANCARASKPGSVARQRGGAEMLDDIRVLEVSAPETMMAGRILADLGADVVLVEPPGGSAGRRLEPFLDDIPGLERSLTWRALNRNKRAITLNLNSADGHALLA